MQGPSFFAVELDTVEFGAEVGAVHGWLTRPRLVRRPGWSPVQTAETLRASDMGYRTRPADAVQAVYPPLLDRAFEVDRRIPLAPGATAMAAAWGRLRLLNPGGAWDAVAVARSCDGQVVRALWGRKSVDGRLIPIDPPYASLAVAFAGVAQGWHLSETALEVPLRDATYWIERPIQQNLYTGSGGLEGPTELTGQPKPKTRGGTAGNPIRDIAPVLVDPTNRIYQWNDGPGQVIALYEGGDANITHQANVADLYAGATNPGQYRTDNARGLIQLGSAPVRPITIDAVGHFPGAGAVSSAAMIVKHLLLEDVGVEAAYLDEASFAAVAAAHPYVAGWAWTQEPEDAVTAISYFLRGLGAKLIPTRGSKLRIVTLRALSGSEAPAATIAASTALEVVPAELGAPLDPPPYRWRVGYQRRHADLGGSISPNITDGRRQFLQSAYRWGIWASGDVLAAWRRPSDPDPLETALLVKSDADVLAEGLGALWGVRRRLYSVPLPFSVAVSRELGEVVRLTYPLDDLRSGRSGIVVGEQQRAGEATGTLMVLV